jgi:hypothetical protein
MQSSRQSIETKYHGATNTRGARISARATNGDRLSIPFPHDARSTEDAHAQAALALARRLQWEGDMLAGSTARGYVFVFADAPRYALRPVARV